MVHCHWSDGPCNQIPLCDGKLYDILKLNWIDFVNSFGLIVVRLTSLLHSNISSGMCEHVVYSINSLLLVGLCVTTILWLFSFMPWRIPNVGSCGRLQWWFNRMTRARASLCNWERKTRKISKKYFVGSTKRGYEFFTWSCHAKW